MKKLLLLAPALLLIAACAPTPSSEPSSSSSTPSSTPSSEPSSSTPSSSEEDSMFAKDKVKVYFFESGVKYDRYNPYHLVEVEVGSKITDPGIPASTDPAFNVFVGWSSKPIVMDDSELWNFQEDSLPNYVPGGEYYLYGQWDYVG